jgi:hypothetical protein
MSASGHVARGALINRHSPGVSARESENRDQWVRDAAQRELEQARVSLLVIATAGWRTPVVLAALGLVKS